VADLKKTIEIIFAGVDNVSSTIVDVNNSVGDFSGKVEDATQPLANLASSIAKTELAVAALGIATLAYAHGQAVELQDAETSLQKVLTESEGSVDQYAGAIKELSLEYGVAATEVTGAAADYKQAGFTIAESLGLVDTTLKAVQIAELSASEASFLLISNIRGIGAEADVATHYLDAWNAVSNEYATTAGEVAKATGLLAPIAKTAGLSFDELVGLATPMIEVLGSGAVVGTALKVSLANLISPTSRVQEALSELGISQRDANGELKLSGELIGEVAEKWPDLTNSQQANYGLLLFGKEHYSKMNIVLNDYDKVLKVTETSINSQNSATEEWIIKQKTAEIAAQRLSVALTNASSTVGKQYIDSTTDITNSLTNLIGTFDQVVASGGLKPLFDYLNPLLDEFSDNLDIVAKNLPDAFKGVNFDGLIESFRAIGFEFGDIFGDVDLTSTEGLKDAIQGIVDGLTILNELFAGVVEGFGPVIEAFKYMGEEATEAEGSTANFVGYIVGTGASINVFAGLLGGVTSAIGGLADVVIVLAGARALGLLPASFAAVGTAMAAHPVIALTTAYTALLAGAVALGKNETVKGFLTDVFVAADKLVGGPLSKANDEFNRTNVEANLAGAGAQVVVNTFDSITKSATDAQEPVGDLADNLSDLGGVKVIDSTIPKTIEDIGEASSNSTSSLIAFSESLNAIGDGDYLQSLADFKNGINNIELDKLAGDIESLGGSFSNFISEAKEFGDSFDEFETGKFESELVKSKEAINGLVPVFGDGTSAVDGFKKEVKDGVTVYSDFGDSVEGMSSKAKESADKLKSVDEALEGLSGTTKSTATVAKSLQDAFGLTGEEAVTATIKFQEMEVELESIASNERIKNMEFAVDFAIANVEADAKKIVATFEAVASSYSATADLVGTLFGSDAPDWDSFGFDTERAAKQATKLLEEQWEKQKELTDATIKQMEAQTKRMASGGALITVDGGELQPELELVMQALFENIRIKMSSDYEDYLLALGQV